MADLNLQQYLSIINRRELSWAFCICCTLLVLGIGLTFQAPWVDWDASDYINVAENIVNGKGIVSGWESDTIHKFWSLTVWPPFYPILIAAFMTLGFTSVSAAMWIQIFAFTGIVIISFFFGKEIDSPLVGYLCAISILCMSTLWELSRMALTEIPYIFFSSVGLYLLLRYVNSKNYWLLVLSALFCGAGAVTRYMGITLILTGFLILVLQSRKRTLSDLMPALAFGVISSIPVCLVFLRNIEVTGHFSGADRGGGSGIFTGVTHDLIQVLVSDLNPFKVLFSERISDWVSIGILSFLVIVAVFLLYGVYIENKTRFILLVIHFLSKKCIVISYIIIYITALVLLEIGMGDIASIQTRYLLPIYPFLVILCLSFMRGACSQVKIGSWRVICISICTILVVCFVFSQVLVSLPVIYEKGGRYYTDPVWYDEPVEEYQWVMQNLPQGGEVFSNNPRALQLHTSRAIPVLPERGNAVQAQKLLTKLHPGQMIVSFKGKKSNEQYMNGEDFFAYNKNFSTPGMYKTVFTSQDATVYQVISPAS